MINIALFQRYPFHEIGMKCMCIFHNGMFKKSGLDIFRTPMVCEAIVTLKMLNCLWQRPILIINKALCQELVLR